MSDPRYPVGEWLVATTTKGKLVEGKQYYVFQSDSFHELARLSEKFGGVHTVEGTFSFGYLDTCMKRLHA